MSPALRNVARCNAYGGVRTPKQCGGAVAMFQAFSASRRNEARVDNQPGSGGVLCVC